MLSVSLNKAFPSFLPDSPVDWVWTDTPTSSSSWMHRTRHRLRRDWQVVQLPAHDPPPWFCPWNTNHTSANYDNPSKVLQGRKEGNVLFNDALNTFYLRLSGVTHMVKDHSDSEREETRCFHMSYSFRLAARVLLYASSHRQDNITRPLLHQSWSTGWNEKYQGARCSSMVKSVCSWYDGSSDQSLIVDPLSYF